MSADKPRDSSSPGAVLVLDDDRFLAHVAPPEHPERGERLLAVRRGLDRALAQLAPEKAYERRAVKDATEEQLARVHDADYLSHLGHLAGQTGYLDSDTYLSPGSVPAALRAAGAAVALVDALVDGPTTRAFAVPRPPGHHALADRAMGFCVLNNVAVAAAHARARGKERVLVLDWDVHHGNGTEAIFYEDPSVLFISLHQFPNYPGTGLEKDVGRADGRGRNVNLPLPPGGADALYDAAFARIVLPIVEQFSPELALVSCGFDAHVLDPLASMSLSSAAYGAMTRQLLGVLPQSCPLGLLLEGGYDLQALTESSESVARALWGAPSERAPAPSAKLAPEEESRLRDVERAQSPYWKLA